MNNTKTAVTTKQRIETKKEKIANLKKQIENLEIKESKRIHNIAKKVGLYDIEFSDDDLAHVLKTFIQNSKKNQESAD